MQKLILSVFLGLFLCSNSWAQKGSFSGSVTDAKSGETLVGVVVQLLETGVGVVSDSNGNYTFTAIPAKSYNVKASYLGYVSLVKYDVVIRSEGNIDVDFALEPVSKQLKEAVVKANPFTKSEETPLSQQKLSQQEIVSYPGGNNDVAKVVQSLPGISGSIGGFRNDVIIRGGSPGENVYYLDGVEIPNINHFSTQGSAGGPVGMLNVAFFEGVKLTTGAFAAQYDNVLSGVLQFDQRKGNERHFQANARLGASESGLTLEGPLFRKGKEKSATSYIISARRSYLQFLFQWIGLPILPDYWDYQYKIQHQINPYNSLILTGIGSIDDFSVNELDGFDPEQKAVQEQVPIIRQRTNTIGLIWKRRFKSNKGFTQLALSNNRLANRFERFRDNVQQMGLYLSNVSTETESKLRYTHTYYTGAWTITSGLSLQLAQYTNQTKDLINGANFDAGISFWKYGAFTQASRRFFKERVGLSVGLRTDGNSYTKEGYALQKTLSPRLAVNYRIDSAGKWNWNASIGRYFKLPPYTVLGFKDNTGNYNNKNVHYIQSDQLVMGLEYLLTESSRISIEGFYKYYNHYPVSITDSVSLANKGGGFEVLGNEAVSSIGKGKAYGVELLYQQKFTGKLYSIVALTLYRSLFSGLNASDFRPSSWDNGQLLSLTGGYKFAKNWDLSGRFRYLGKTPYAPVDQAATLANYPLVVRDYDRLGEVQLSTFQQLDLRIDKKWNFKKWSLDVYLDVQNVLAAATPSEPSYGLKRDSQGNIVQPNSLVQVNTTAAGTVIPSIGLVLNL